MHVSGSTAELCLSVHGSDGVEASSLLLAQATLGTCAKHESMFVYQDVGACMCMYAHVSYISCLQEFSWSILLLFEHLPEETALCSGYTSI